MKFANSVKKRNELKINYFNKINYFKFRRCSEHQGNYKQAKDNVCENKPSTATMPILVQVMQDPPIWKAMRSCLERERLFCLALHVTMCSGSLSSA